MTRSKLEKLVLTAMFCAIIIAMTFIPFVGYITYGGLSLTTLHVVAILGAVTLGPVRGAVIGLVWGATCLLYAMMNGTADAVIFLNPLISVVPRVIVGFAAGWYFRWFAALFRKIPSHRGERQESEQEKRGNAFSRWLRSFRGKGPEVAASAVAAALGTLTNTALVITAIQLFGGSGVVKMGAVLQAIVDAALAVNMSIELPLAVIVVPAIATPLFQLMRRQGAK
ncbi:MAG TPA: ECF transporter S component [Firmicutes bacterium]|nr:ECF transporter S component [Bacillota bacterium]